MKLLVIAYEFPPVLSGQSIRWLHLANALADLGVEVHVLAPAFAGRYADPSRMRERLVVHRCFPGPFVGFAAGLAARVGKGLGASSASLSQHGLGRTTRQRASDCLERGYRGVREVLNHLLFPDVRSEWFPSAWMKLKGLVPQHRYDLIVSSHEPGVTLLLGLAAQKRWVLPWVVDLGDPLVGPLTPIWRHRLDLKVEKLVCRRADRLVVTCPEMLDLLAERHPQIPRQELSRKLAVIPQGFPIEEDSKSGASDHQKTERQFTLIFTGTLNSPLRRVFQTGTELAAALAELPYHDVQVVFAGSAHSRGEPLEGAGNRVRLLGMIDHAACRALQRNATVLLSVANDRHYQIPGKLFEYFGACRPILHLTVGTRDPAAKLLHQLHRGIVVENQRAAIRSALGTLHAWWENGTLDQQFDLSHDSVREYAWPSLALRFLHECNCAREEATTRTNRTGGST
jgi:hypothetical protein